LCVSLKDYRLNTFTASSTQRLRSQGDGGGRGNGCCVDKTCPNAEKQFTSVSMSRSNTLDRTRPSVYEAVLKGCNGFMTFVQRIFVIFVIKLSPNTRSRVSRKETIEVMARGTILAAAIISPGATCKMKMLIKVLTKTAKSQ